MSNPLQDELRRQLNGLGIEWTSDDFFEKDDVTNWGGRTTEGRWKFSFTTVSGMEPWFSVNDCTPEQALRAAVGSESW